MYYKLIIILKIMIFKFYYLIIYQYIKYLHIISLVTFRILDILIMFTNLKFDFNK